MSDALQNLVTEDQEQIDSLEAASNDFMARILGLAPGECAMSDLSELSDFSLCGPDLGLPGDASLAKLRDAWDADIIGRIKQVYDIDVETTRINMVTLLAQVDAVMKRQVH